MHQWQVKVVTGTGNITGMGNSLIWFPLMLRYRNEVHSENRAGKDEI